MRSFIPTEGHSGSASASPRQRSKTVLVNGGAGFLGSHLCERLLERGHEVICLDNFHTGRRVNIEHLLANTRFRLLEHDVRQPYDVEASVIFNFASPASPPDYQRDPVGTLLTNVLGAVNTLDCARKAGATVVQSSTSEVYGDPNQSPQRESYCGNVNPIGPRGCYDEAKRFAEAIVMAYHRMHGIDTKIVRIFNTYGPRMRLIDGRIVPNFVKQALLGEPLTIYGDGTQTRDYIYVGDVVAAALAAGATRLGGAVNIGTGREASVLDLVEILARLAGRDDFVPEFAPPRAGEVQRISLDASLAERELDWAPRTTLEQGLEQTLAAV